MFTFYFFKVIIRVCFLFPVFSCFSVMVSVELPHAYLTVALLEPVLLFFFFNQFWKNLIVISSGNAFTPFPSVLWFSDYRYVNLGFLCCFPFLSWCFYLSGYFLNVASGSFLSPAIHGRLFIYIEQKIYIEYFHTSGCILNYKMSFWFILHWNSLVVQFIKLD